MSSSSFLRMDSGYTATSAFSGCDLPEDLQAARPELLLLCSDRAQLLLGIRVVQVALDALLGRGGSDLTGPDVEGGAARKRDELPSVFAINSLQEPPIEQRLSQAVCDVAGQRARHERIRGVQLRDPCQAAQRPHHVALELVIDLTV